MSTCEWCGVKTKAVERTCHGCKGVIKTLGRPHDPAAGLERGTWHTRPGGVQVWISWDEDVA